MPKHPKHPTLDENCIGCHSLECVVHGERQLRGEHVHAPDFVVQETYWQPLVPGTSAKTFKYPICACGAVYLRDAWYVKEVVDDPDPEAA